MSINKKLKCKQILWVSEGTRRFISLNHQFNESNLRPWTVKSEDHTQTKAIKRSSCLARYISSWVYQTFPSLQPPSACLSFRTSICLARWVTRYTIWTMAGLARNSLVVCNRTRPTTKSTRMTDLQGVWLRQTSLRVERTKSSVSMNWATSNYLMQHLRLDLAAPQHHSLIGASKRSRAMQSSSSGTCSF